MENNIKKVTIIKYKSRKITIGIAIGLK